MRCSQVENGLKSVLFTRQAIPFASNTIKGKNARLAGSTWKQLEHCPSCCQTGSVLDQGCLWSEGRPRNEAVSDSCPGSPHGTVKSMRQNPSLPFISNAETALIENVIRALRTRDFLSNRATAWLCSCQGNSAGRVEIYLMECSKCEIPEKHERTWAGHMRSPTAMIPDT